MKLKAVVFDFDYTLGDSTDGIVLSVNYGLENLGHEQKSVEEIRRTIGLSLGETYRVLTGREDAKEAEQFACFFKEQADRVMAESAKLYEGVKHMLADLQKQCKTAIVTTKFHYRIEQILGKYDANALVDLIVGAEDVKAEKPSPEGLLYVLQQLGLEKDEVLYVGDSVVDAKTARNADVAFAAVLTGTTGREVFEAYDCLYIGETVADVYEYITKE